MSTTRSNYTHRGVQTDLPSTPPAFSQAAMDPLSYPQSDRVDTPPASPSPSNRSRPSTPVESIHNHSHTDISFDSISSGADQSMTTTSRALKVQLPTNRPSALQHRQPSSRIVSLPDATPRFRMKNVLERTTTRVVSMPTETVRDTSDGLDVDYATESLLHEAEEHSCSLVRSQVADVPYTSSLPSSPDSVVIIANNSNPLSRDFLRHDLSNVTPPESDDGEWVTWAKSPPRPIPALHGPLSLPYARCPSGAEGTIIEEQESLSRVIWGLENDNTTGSRPSFKSTNVPPASLKTHTHPHGDPFRHQKSRQPHGSAAAPSLSQKHLPPGAHSSTTVARVAPSQHPPQPPDYMLKHSEPIDLGRLTRDAQVSNGLPRVLDWQPPVSAELPTPELIHDLTPEMQAIMFAQDTLKTSSFLPSFSTRPSPPQVSPLSNLVPSTSSSSLLESLKSSRSPIVLEELASHWPPSGNSSRASALDLAQRYRQQQFQHGFLPTPPDSTSPVWSSTFSPYQGAHHGSGLSPDLLVATGSSQHPATYHPQATLSVRDHSQHFLRPSPGILSSNPVMATRNVAFGSAAASEPTIGQSLAPRLAAEQVSRTVPETYTEEFRRLLSQLSIPVREPARSPTLPKVPPNTPHAPSNQHTRRFEASSTPPRQSQNLMLSQNNVRSVPLSRLVQRRLSTVPEEDFMDHRRTPPAASQSSAAGLHLFLSPAARASGGPVVLDSFGDPLGLQCRSTVNVVENAKPSVKLPGVPGKASGPVTRGEGAMTREDFRRQGSNANTDGGRRSENGRGRGHKRGGRGRRGRGAIPSIHGAERIDGGMVVRS
ncbi:uncharacterized protein BXZ73DRAFT_47471 [Epithele typhae]|uniref:uncharacterized protein n=1 Tax=Epithele typhae TaxID=378194 RepID=UPI0020082E54|nr:uncharacterized protein BXZ73DRAFT_47471 [Epithele typhae]KAH9931097.1 hypothetical protein BXZ73DRAFT_47471 [Epithele typhae]